MSRIRIGNQVNDFEVGDRVTYVPIHLLDKFSSEGYRTKGIERGVVHRVTENWIFVRYILNGELGSTPQATDARDLINNEKE